MVIENKLWDIWVEGYCATGQDAQAYCPRSGIAAPSFNEAVEIWIQEEGFEKECRFNGTTGYWSHWGCRLFDNEADARKEFG